MSIGQWFKDNGSTLLTCLGGGGMIATVTLAIKATPSAWDKIETAQNDKSESVQAGDESYEASELTVIETIRACWRDYIPTVAIGIGSLACIFGANALNRRQQASMAAAYTALASAFKAYRGKIRDILGPGTDEAMQKAVEQEKQDEADGRPPWDEVQTFYMDCGKTPKFFERTMHEILQAEYEANRYFILNGSLTLNEFLKIFGLDAVESGDHIGWDAYIGETEYGYQWIDFAHRWFDTDDGLTVCSIDFPFPPHPIDDVGGA